MMMMTMTTTTTTTTTTTMMMWFLQCHTNNGIRNGSIADRFIAMNILTVTLLAGVQ